MPRLIDNWLDATIARLGYTKARSRQIDISTLHSGEAPIGSGMDWEAVDQEGWERLAITSAWVFSDIDLISAEAGRAALEIHQRKGEETESIPNHEFEQLIARPNRFMGESYLRRYTLWWWLLRGEAYWWLVQDRAGNLAEIWPVPSNRMRPIPDPEQYIAGYGYLNKRGEPELTIPVNQICYFRFPNPFDFHRGLSKLTSYSNALKTDTGARDWNQGIFEDGVPFRVILSGPEVLSEANRAKFKADLREEFEARKRMLVTFGGDISATELGMSHRDMEFLAGREFTRDEIDRVFGVPAGFWAKDATRANTEGARATLIDLTIMPMLNMMAEEIDSQILEMYYPGDNLTCIPEDIRMRDRALEVEEQRQHWQVMTVNEARQELGLDELEDEELGEQLVPIAIKAQPPGASPPPQFGGIPGQPEPEMPEPEATEVVEREQKADLRRWQSIALRRLKAGEPPGEYDFESFYLDADTVAHIKAMLDGAESEQEVRAAFAAPFPAQRQAAGPWRWDYDYP